MTRSRPSGTTQRVFLALDPPLLVREELFAWLRQARVGRQLRPVKPENMHMTLAFLGERSEGEISEAAAIVSGFVDQAPELAIGAPVWLPQRRPRAFAVEVRGLDSRLTDLQSGLQSSLEAVLGSLQRRTFRPHITVARIPRDFRPRREPPPPTPPLEFRGESLSLYRSHLLPEGAEYEALYTWPLASETDSIETDS